MITNYLKNYELCSENEYKSISFLIYIEAYLYFLGIVGLYETLYFEYYHNYAMRQQIKLKT